MAALAAAVALLLFLRPATTTTLQGAVVDANGEAVAGARVESPEGAHGTTDDAGRFAFTGPVDGTWVTVTADGFLPRTRAVRPDHDTLVRLAPGGDGTLTIAFGGDVMFGRRYFDRDLDGSMVGQLALDADAADHRALLAGIEPLLASADLTVVNLESSLTADPHLDPAGPRSDVWHPDKSFVFSSLPAAAQGLADSGVDLVGIGNNHLYDRLEVGVASTVAALDDAGFQLGTTAFGGGADLDDAWRPALLTSNGQRIAFLGCTTVRGSDEAMDTVAGRAGPEDPGEGGPAPCDEERLVTEVAAAGEQADTVVVQLHGGAEYGRSPSANIQRLSDAAVAAGADLVVNHHPHVVGGLRHESGALTAWTMGNLLFDQRVWPTFESYVLFAAVRDGEVSSAWIEPIRLQELRPTGLTGDAADWVARGALARSEGPWHLDDGSLWLTSDGPENDAPVSLDEGEIALTGTACALDGARELLWSGDFEDDDLDPSIDGGALWNVSIDDNDARSLLPEAAANGRLGVRLSQSSGRTKDLLLQPPHRVPVDPGDELTLLLQWRRVLGTPDADLELAWFNDTIGPSVATTSVPFTADDRAWQEIRVDVTAPAGTRAVGVRIRIRPPRLGKSVLDVDDVRLVSWSEPGCDALRSSGRVRAALHLASDDEVTLVDTAPTPVPPPPALPPAPPRSTTVE